jgi:hypothetical protein
MDCFSKIIDTYMEHQKIAGPLQLLLIPKWKWGDITIDFMSGLPKRKKGSDIIWVIVDHLIKSTFFLPIK